MIRARLLLLAPLLALCLAGPALAHKLRVYATHDGSEISGRAFFIGGGGARGVDWVARDSGGVTVATGQTDDNGGFRFALPTAAAGLTVSVNTGDGHMASATLGGVAEAPAPAAAAASDTAAIEAAVARQVAPLLARIEEMDARLRFTDALSGVFFILGLAGMALWARGRRG